MARSTRRTIFFSFLPILFLLGIGMGFEWILRLTSQKSVERYQQLQNVTLNTGYIGSDKLFVPDDSLFWRLKPKVTLPKSNQETPWQGHLSGPEGFRNREAFFHTNRPIVLAMGDSTVFCQGVETQECWVGQLDQKLAGKYNLRAFNAGVPGFSSYQGKKLLKELLDKLNPKLVTLTFGNNDGAFWAGKSDDAQASARGIMGLINKSFLLSLVRAKLFPLFKSSKQQYKQYSWDDDELTEDQNITLRVSPEEYLQNTKEMIAMIKDAGARPAFIIWPLDEAINGERNPRAKYQAVTKQLANDFNIPLLDLTDPFLASGQELALYFDSIHGTPVAQNVATVAIWEWIQPLLSNSIF